MAPFEVAYLLVCGIGTLNSLLLVFYFASRKTGVRVLNISLSFILLTFSLRVSKALWLYFFEESHPILHALWYPAFIAMGFAIVYYSGKFSNNSKTEIYKQILFQAVTLTLLFIVYTYLFNKQVEITFFLVLSTGLVVINFNKYRTKFAPIDKIKLNWINSFTVYFLIITAAYLGLLFISYNLLIVESFIFSIFIYILIFAELRFHLIQKIHTPKKTITEEELRIIKVVETLMLEEKLYFNPNLNLSTLAKKTGKASHLLSKTINNATGMNFNDYINSFRIEEVKKILINEKNNRKISSIAYDCGFNSISVFNSAFKKYTGTTPSAFSKNN